MSGVRGGGPAAEAGLAAQDIVRFVGDAPVQNLEQIRKLYDQRYGATLRSLSATLGAALR